MRGEYETVSQIHRKNEAGAYLNLSAKTTEKTGA